MLDRPSGEVRATETFPAMQRGGIKFFRRMTRGFIAFFRQIGARGYFLRDIGRAFGDPATFVPETIRQMRGIGVDSLPLTVIVAAFIGGVIAIQTRYQLFPGVQLSIIGLSTRLMIVLELGPLLTGLVLTGRVGARMTAEIGTMRVTEQIDALETLS
ncbi:MAG: MlaE family ABC transporter permease, partial [Gemmatimonadaceae bacterium]